MRLLDDALFVVLIVSSNVALVFQLNFDIVLNTASYVEI
jgi:hypothetical protein